MAQGYKLVTRKVTDLKGGEVQEKIYAIPDYNGYIDMDTLCIMIGARSAFSSVDVNFYVPGADCLRQTSRLTVHPPPKAAPTFPFRPQLSKSCLPEPPLSQKADRQPLKSVSCMIHYFSLLPAIVCARPAKVLDKLVVEMLDNSSVFTFVMAPVIFIFFSTPYPITITSSSFWVSSCNVI